MNTPEIILAHAVARMLGAENIEPTPAVAFAPSLERADLDGGRIVVAPGAIEAPVVDRSGRRVIRPNIDVAVIEPCDPDDVDAVTALLVRCGQIADLLATKRPLDESMEPTPGRAVEITQDPLYSAEHLRSGVFIGIVSARYTL